jgi:uncharacterized protein with HEPN domain
MKRRLEIDDSVLEAFCANHHVTRLALFGSVLEGRDHPESDVDLLVEFEPGREPGLLALAAMESELSKLLRRTAIEILGEAAGRMSSETQSHIPSIPWSSIVGMRNRLIHGDFDIDAEIVWKTATVELPHVLQELRRHIASLD